VAASSPSKGRRRRHLLERRDRAELAREAPPAKYTTSFEQPADAIEAQVAAIWCRMFGLREVGVNDDFFELNGDSLLAVR
jgi:hypothetical protein